MTGTALVATSISLQAGGIFAITTRWPMVNAITFAVPLDVEGPIFQGLEREEQELLRAVAVAGVERVSLQGSGVTASANSRRRVVAETGAAIKASLIEAGLAVEATPLDLGNEIPRPTESTGPTEHSHIRTGSGYRRGLAKP
jgi:hypothetical protein